MKKFWYLTLILVPIALTGCSSLMGGLRRDFDDGDVYGSNSPTTGGRWAERGLLHDEYAADEPETYAAVGHAERGLASADEASPGVDRLEDYGARQASQSRGVAQKPKYKKGNRATRSDFIDEATNEGSLWAPEGQTNYYFTKNKIRSVGDIVNVTVDEQLVKDVAMEIKRTLTRQEQQTELAIAQAKLMPGGTPAVSAVAQDPSSKAVTGAAAAGSADKGSADSEKEPPVATMKDVDVLGAVELKANDTLMAEIIERYPNGNYKIRGTKRVIYKNGSPRLLEITAIARAQDITEEDVVNSGKLYEYRLEALR